MNAVRHRGHRQPHHDRGGRLHPANLAGSGGQGGRTVPCRLAAEGSCTIGGNLGTNAAARRWCATATRATCAWAWKSSRPGRCGAASKGLRKDNTGYDLRDLFIGSEGTLGIITAACMKLTPARRQAHRLGRRAQPWNTPCNCWAWRVGSWARA